MNLTNGGVSILGVLITVVGLYLAQSVAPNPVGVAVCMLVFVVGVTLAIQKPLEWMGAQTSRFPWLQKY